MRTLGSALVSVVVCLVALAVAAPLLIVLSHALVPVLIVGGAVVIAVRLAVFHTRRW